MDNLIEAKKFLNQPVFQKLGQELARRYYSKGSFGLSVGRQLFRNESDEALRQFLGITEWEWKSRKAISVESFERALKNSLLEWSLAEFVVFTTEKPLQLKSDVEEKKRVLHANFVTRLNQIDPLFSEKLNVKQLTQWHEDLGGDFEIFEAVSKALKQLPKEWTRLPVCSELYYFLGFPFFAYQQTGDAHFFDETKNGGRLLLQMLTALSWRTENDKKLSVVEEKNIILNEFQLLRDDIHNFVSVHGLVAEKNNIISQMWLNAWSEGVTWNVPLKEILRMDSIYPGQGNKVLIIENSAVYSVLLELVPEIAIICSSGQFTYAVWQLLRKLSENNVKLYYSGDLDPEGLLMAEKLIEMFPDQVQTIGMSLESYQVGQQLSKLLPQQLKQLQKINSNELKLIAKKMEISHIKAYQEGYLEIILAEINEKIQN